jgi:hypothetical protein
LSLNKGKVFVGNTPIGQTVLFWTKTQVTPRSLKKMCMDASFWMRALEVANTKCISSVSNQIRKIKLAGYSSEEIGKVGRKVADRILKGRVVKDQSELRKTVVMPYSHVFSNHL